MTESLTINGIEYVPKSKQVCQSPDGKPYVIIRTYSAGVFAGFLSKREGREVELLSARRLWYWKGAASLSQLAMEGVSKPEECKFAVPVISIILLEAIEIINCTDNSRASIAGVPLWKA